MSGPDPEILAFYAQGLEDARLFEDSKGLLERARTEELLLRFLPEAPDVVLDVGGASGHYAVWLAARGYDVHLIDPVVVHIEQAERQSRASERSLASTRLGDARSLPMPTESAGAVLLLGPLYHMTQREDRIAALVEARRVLRPGAVVLAALISRYASALDGLVKHLFDDPVFQGIVERDLTDGQHRDRLSDGTRGQEQYFTTAYLHHPDEIAGEFKAAGLQHEATLSIEGPAWLLQDLDQQWQDARRRSTILSVAHALEAEPSLLGASSHLFVVARKPAW